MQYSQFFLRGLVMMNHKPNSAVNAHRPVTPASIVVDISGACRVPFNPALGECLTQ
jgi:hypothetical protein